PDQGAATAVAGFDIRLRDREYDDAVVAPHAAPAAPRVLQRNALRVECPQAAHLLIRNRADLAQRHGGVPRALTAEAGEGKTDGRSALERGASSSPYTRFC